MRYGRNWSQGWKTGSGRASGDGNRGEAKLTTWLSDWPVEQPRAWVARVNRPDRASELEALWLSVKRGRPFGEEAWVRRLARRFGMESTLRPRGRPRAALEKTPDPFSPIGSHTRMMHLSMLTGLWLPMTQQREIISRPNAAYGPKRLPLAVSVFGTAV